MQLLIDAGEEILTEDLDQTELFDAFYHLGAEKVYVVDDNNIELFEVTEELATFVDTPTCCVVPEGYYTHAQAWGSIAFDIILDDPNHTLTAADFQWCTKDFPGDLTYSMFGLSSEVGVLSLSSTSDFNYDETIGVPGRPGPEDFISEPVEGE